jgi:hypothetical protein
LRAGSSQAVAPLAFWFHELLRVVFRLCARSGLTARRAPLPSLGLLAVMSKVRLLMIEGERHGRLVFLENLGVDAEAHSIGRFLCDCGVVCVKRLAQVRSSNTRSCGCLWWEAKRRPRSNGSANIPVSGRERPKNADGAPPSAACGRRGEAPRKNLEPPVGTRMRAHPGRGGI